MTSPLPAYAVPGVKPVGGTDDLRSVEYAVDQLAAFPPVAAALDHTPDVLSAIRFDGEMWDEFSATRADLCAELWVGTGDGLSWELSFGDGGAQGRVAGAPTSNGSGRRGGRSSSSPSRRGGRAA